ncbi:SHD1 domain-containing protein [Neorhodopirellula lusitana]|uniref:SHD1 domain-containing protein n=1 Tax=Neorhodopirellula lusitana TaxID=445327 RepID=UPI00385042B4
MTRVFLFLMFAASLVASPAVMARTWTSSSGDYSLEADAVAFNDHSVILKRSTGKLVSVQLDELSEQDRNFVKSKELGQQLSTDIEQMQTWTSKDGVSIRGRVLAYGKKDMTVVRQRGKEVVNGKPFDEFTPLHQRLILRILSELENQEFANEHELNKWAKTLEGQTKVYPLEGVLMQLESGDKIAVPFFLFGKKELDVLKPGWNAWSSAHADDVAKQNESLMMQTEARQYQQQQNQQQQESTQRQQIEILRLNMLAARTGLTSFWEVGLEPGPGVYGRRTSVMVTAQNSDIASQMVLSRYPGYRVFGVRRASR